MTQSLGLDLGGTNIKWALVDRSPDPSIIRKGNLSTEAEAGPEAVTGLLADTARRVVDESDEIDRVGLAIPGLFDETSGEIVLFPNLPGPWAGFSLGGRLEEHLGLPVTMINDGQAFTIAESTLGAGKGCRIVVALVLGTGIGGGIAVDGHLHLGAFGTAGELGHQIVFPNGPMCGCGNRGCLEAVAKAGALAQLAGRATAEEVYDAAAAGDQRCRDAIAEVAGYLAIALANTITMLGPDRIVVGGGIAGAGGQLLGPLRDALLARVTLVPPEQVDIVPAALGSYAGAVGAALAANARKPGALGSSW